ncbi:MAG TPA: hypothetical protein VHW23_11965 [Kofleriaceae bacterium]|jgi:hypothetical protein|nr:hypothetical protein [Kofleriaceae bacterium]
MLPVLAMVLTASAGVALAQPRPMPPQPVWDSRGWVMLGERTVNGQVDHDRIDVGRQDGRFNKLTMVVENSDLELIDFRIVFGDRTEYRPKLSYVFREGQRTRAIDLPPSEAVIRFIDIQYRNLSAGQARVQIWGFRTGGAAAPPPPPAPPAPAWDPKGWSLLGERTVDGRFDHDRIDVGRYQGRFSKLTVVVENSDLELVDMSIKFERGEPWRPGVQGFFREGQRTRVIDFPGEERIIKHIDFQYRNLPGGGRARVAVYGLRETPVWESRGWTMLGERTVDSNREDYDRIEVPRGEGRFRKLTVVVLDGDLEMLDMLVELGHGEPFRPEINARFRENTRTRVIDLPGEQRRLHGIQFRYRNLPGGAHARVQVWAR